MATVVGYLLIFFVLAGVLVYIVYMSDAAIGHLDFASSKVTANLVIDIVKRHNLQDGIFYDLGSARGTFSSRIAKGLPKLLVYGIDNSRFRVFCSNIRAGFFNNLQFKEQDIFNTDFSTADVIYLYLPQELMPALQTKLQKELKTGSLIISNAVSFASWIPSETVAASTDTSNLKKLFVYKIA